MRSLIRCVLYATMLVAIVSPVFGQSSGSSTSSGENPSGNPRNGAGGGAAGGGTRADFTTLMNLIQQTITPDDWLDNGGSNTMIPYPNGVLVDPKGRLNQSPTQTGRNASIEDRLRNSGSVAEAGNKAWQTPSDLRMISLRKLDQSLADASLGKIRMSADFIRLGGLNQISHILIDPANEDIVLAGPADPDHLGFFLEDLAVICSLVNQQTKPLGCSIEPKQDRLLATQRFLANPDASALLSKSPKRFADQLGEIIGDYDIHVFGMNPRCGTAIALVSADEHMKQLGFGKVSLPVKVKSYFDHLESQSTVPAQSIIRWWFAYSDAPIYANSSRTFFSLPKNTVRVMSEQQLVTLTGRKPTGEIDPAADAFASEISEKMDRLRNYDPNYSRLCCVFETALGLQAALDSSGLGDLSPWFPNLCGLGKAEQQNITEPKTVPGLVTTRTMKKKKTNVAVISGGVTISPTAQKLKNKPTNSETISSDRLILEKSSKAPDSQNSWWWD